MTHSPLKMIAACDAARQGAARGGREVAGAHDAAQTEEAAAPRATRITSMRSWPGRRTTRRRRSGAGQLDRRGSRPSAGTAWAGFRLGEARQGRLAMYARAIDERRGSCASCRSSSGASSVLLSLRSGLPVTATQFHRGVSLSPSCSEVSSWERAASIRSGAGGTSSTVSSQTGTQYVIAEVRAYAARQATMARRHSFATAIRSTVQETAPSRISAAAQELEALAQELDDENLELDPACAVACMRLLEDPADSSLLDAVAPRRSCSGASPGEPSRLQHRRPHGRRPDGDTPEWAEEIRTRSARGRMTSSTGARSSTASPSTPASMGEAANTLDASFARPGRDAGRSAAAAAARARRPRARRRPAAAAFPVRVDDRAHRDCSTRGRQRVRDARGRGRRRGEAHERCGSDQGPRKPSPAGSASWRRGNPPAGPRRRRCRATRC